MATAPATSRNWKRSPAEIADWGEIADHAAYVAELRKNHGRKYGFWSLTEAKPKR